jgi:hypothetical protein
MTTTTISLAMTLQVSQQTTEKASPAMAGLFY